MKTAPVTPTDELFQVERRIARRADELVRERGVDPAHSLAPWRQAEREVWREVKRRCTLASAIGA
jgi:hypothetical protein